MHFKEVSCGGLADNELQLVPIQITQDEDGGTSKDTKRVLINKKCLMTSITNLIKLPWLNCIYQEGVLLYLL